MDNISTVISLILGFCSLCGILFTAYRWFLLKDIGDKKQDEKFDKLEKTINEKIDMINSENEVVVFGLLSCLDGLEQIGANGNVTKAHAALSKHINNRAHK